MAYICGFDRENKELCLHTEHQWKTIRDYMKRNGCNYAREWARSGKNVIDSVVNTTQYNVQESYLRLVCHLQEIQVYLDEK